MFYKSSRIIALSTHILLGSVLPPLTRCTKSSVNWHLIKLLTFSPLKKVFLKMNCSSFNYYWKFDQQLPGHYSNLHNRLLSDRLQSLAYWLTFYHLRIAQVCISTKQRRDNNNSHPSSRLPLFRISQRLTQRRTEQNQCGYAATSVINNNNRARTSTACD